MKCACGGELKYQFTAKNQNQEIWVYKCEKCGDEIAKTVYAHTPATCPKHHWGFEGWQFEDGPTSHEISWGLVCDRCGATRKERFDSDAVGLRQAVDPQDPRVLKALKLNEHTARFHLPRDDVQEFWKK